MAAGLPRLFESAAAASPVGGDERAHQRRPAAGAAGRDLEADFADVALMESGGETTSGSTRSSSPGSAPRTTSLGGRRSVLDRVLVPLNRAATGRFLREGGAGGTTPASSRGPAPARRVCRPVGRAGVAGGGPGPGPAGARAGRAAVGGPRVRRRPASPGPAALSRGAEGARLSGVDVGASIPLHLKRDLRPAASILLTSPRSGDVGLSIPADLGRHTGERARRATAEGRAMTTLRDPATGRRGCLGAEPAAEKQQGYAAHDSFAGGSPPEGTVVGGAELQHSRTARTCAAGSSPTARMPETVEQLTGFYLVRSVTWTTSSTAAGSSAASKQPSRSARPSTTPPWNQEGPRS